MIDLRSNCFGERIMMMVVHVRWSILNIDKTVGGGVAIAGHGSMQWQWCRPLSDVPMMWKWGCYKMVDFRWSQNTWISCWWWCWGFSFIFQIFRTISCRNWRWWRVEEGWFGRRMKTHLRQFFMWRQWVRRGKHWKLLKWLQMILMTWLMKLWRSLVIRVGACKKWFNWYRGGLLLLLLLLMMLVMLIIHGWTLSWSLSGEEQHLPI